MNFLRFGVVLSLLVAPGTLLAHRILQFQPAMVECSGKLRLVYFPGRPNYESIKRGDEREGVYILELDESFDIASAGAPKRSLDDPEGWGKNVKRIQLVSDVTLRRRIGKKITVKGKLFEALFVHHHTSVLMDVMKVVGE